MNRNVVWGSLLAVLFLSCGDEKEKRQPECTLFPDSCPVSHQCFEGDPRPELTVCMAPGQRARGESCDEEADDVASFCGRELLCVAYGLNGEDKRCTPMCETDADCKGDGIVPRCITGDREARRFCMLIR